MFLDQRRKSVESLAHVGWPSARCTFTPAGTTITMLIGELPLHLRRTWCPPVQKHAVHHPVRWLPSRPAAAPDRVRQRATALHSSCRPRTPPLAVGVPVDRSYRTEPASTEPEAIRCALEGFVDCLDRVDVEAPSLGSWLYGEPQPARGGAHFDLSRCRRRPSNIP